MLRDGSASPPVPGPARFAHAPWRRESSGREGRMKCREAKETLDRRRALASAEADALALHLRACPHCAAVARTRRLTRLLLQALAADDEPSPYFMARLRGPPGGGPAPPGAPPVGGRLPPPAPARPTLAP